MAPQQFGQENRDLLHDDTIGLDESGLDSHPTFRQPLPNVPIMCDTEELYPKEDYEISETEIILVSVRCVITFICLLGTILVIVATARSSHQRYKSWRLYLLTSLMVLAWMCLSLFRGI